MDVMSEQERSETSARVFYTFPGFWQASCEECGWEQMYKTSTEARRNARGHRCYENGQGIWQDGCNDPKCHR